MKQKRNHPQRKRDHKRSHLKGGIISYALFICLLASVIVGAVLLKRQLSAKVASDYATKVALIRKVDTFFQLLIANEEELLLDYLEDQAPPININHFSFGIYEIVKASIETKKFRAAKGAILGTTCDKSLDFSLYLADNGRPLKVAGKSLLQGNAFVPGARIERSYIEGSPLTPNLIKANAKPSQRIIPFHVNKKLIDLNASLLSGIFDSEDSIVQFTEGLNLHQSFSKKRIVVELHEGVIRDCSLSGNVIIFSNKPLFLKYSAALADVLIYAPSVIVEENFEGAVQIFAKGSIVTEGKCEFKYPSALFVLADDSSRSNDSGITLGKGSEVVGSVVFYSLTSSPKRGITLSEGVKITGRVYSSGFCELGGTIHGQVICDKITLTTRSAYYDNQVFNTTIDKSKVIKCYIWDSFLQSSGTNKIVKWLES